MCGGSGGKESAVSQLVLNEISPLLLFFRGFFLLRRFFLVLGPRWNYADDARIGDRLPQMLGGVTDDEEQNAAAGILAAEPVEALVKVSVGHGLDGCLGVGEGIFQRGDDFRFVG